MKFALQPCQCTAAMALKSIRRYCYTVSRFNLHPHYQSLLNYMSNLEVFNLGVTS